MIDKKTLKLLIDAAVNPNTHSVKLDWKEAKFADVAPMPVIEIVAKDDSYIPLQLCPKCNGDGELPRETQFSTEPYTSISTTPVTCNLCQGAKVIPMIKSAPEETSAYNFESMEFIFPNKKAKPVSIPDIEEYKTFVLNVSFKFWDDKKCPECDTKVNETEASEGRWAVFYECPNCKIKLRQGAWAQGQEPWLSKKL